MGSVDFKPMLAATCEDTAKLVYPVLASHKLDGIRATVRGGILMSRSMKPIPNKQVQAKFAGLAEGMDGELIKGDPTAPDAFRKTTSAVMTEDDPTADISDIHFHTFDLVSAGQFSSRIKDAESCAHRAGPRVTFVKHTLIHSAEELLAFEEAALALGHEGIMVRSLGGLYKQGRSTEKQGWLLKVKRFVDSEAVVLGMDELMHNENEATKNELGHTERSSHKAGLVAAGVLGALQVRDLKSGVEFEIGTGFTAEQRLRFFSNRGENGKPLTIVGLIARYKYFPTGSKDKPRFPVWLGWRAPEDIS